MNGHGKEMHLHAWADSKSVHADMWLDHGNKRIGRLNHWSTMERTAFVWMYKSGCLFIRICKLAIEPSESEDLKNKRAWKRCALVWMCRCGHFLIQTFEATVERNELEDLKNEWVWKRDSFMWMRISHTDVQNHRETKRIRRLREWMSMKKGRFHIDVQVWASAHPDVQAHRVTEWIGRPEVNSHD
jgi:hypothetical protein